MNRGKDADATSIFSPGPGTYLLQLIGPRFSYSSPPRVLQSQSQVPQAGATRRSSLSDGASCLSFWLRPVARWRPRQEKPQESLAEDGRDLGGHRSLLCVLQGQG